MDHTEEARAEAADLGAVALTAAALVAADLEEDPEAVDLAAPVDLAEARTDQEAQEDRDGVGAAFGAPAITDTVDMEAVVLAD